MEPRHYGLFVAALLNAGFSVAGLHLPGHGLAAGEKRFTFQSLLECGLAAENALFAAGFAKVAVCGHSQGGILALAHAGISSQLCAAFSICAVFPRMPEAITLTHFRNLAGQRDRIMNGITRLAKFLPSLPIPLPFYLSLLKIVKGAKKPVHIGEGKNRISYPLEFLASLFNAEISPVPKCPWWLFSAKDDALFTPALTRQVFDHVAAPRKSLVWLPDGGHMAILNPCLSAYVARYMAAVCAGLGCAPYIYSPGV